MLLFIRYRHELVPIVSWLMILRFRQILVDDIEMRLDLVFNNLPTNP